MADHGALSKAYQWLGEGGDICLDTSKVHEWLGCRCDMKKWRRHFPTHPLIFIEG